LYPLHSLRLSRRRHFLDEPGKRRVRPKLDLGLSTLPPGVL
jgi:hypothetical protein